MSTVDHWAHDPDVCPSTECPGCWAEAYRPLLSNADAGEVAKFSAFLRRAKEGPRDGNETMGDLYDQMYSSGREP